MRTNCFQALEHGFCIEVEDRGMLSFLNDVLAPLASPSPQSSVYSLTHLQSRGRERFEVSFDHHGFGRTYGKSHALSLLLWHVNQQAIGRSGQRYVLLHAAAAARDGVVVVLCAPMEAGKTTTVAGLLLQGYDYFTDEAVALDRRTGNVVPFPKSLSIDRGSWEVLASLRPDTKGPIVHQWHVPVTRIPSSRIAEPAPPRVFLLPAYVEGAATRLTHLSRAEMLAELLPSTFNLRSAPREQLDVLRRAVAASDCFRLIIGNLDEAVTSIDSVVDRILS